MRRRVRDRSFGLKGSEWPGVGGRGRSDWWGCTLPLQAVGLVWGAPACAGEGRCSPPPGAMQEAGEVHAVLCVGWCGQCRDPLHGLRVQICPPTGGWLLVSPTLHWGAGQRPPTGLAGAPGCSSEGLRWSWISGVWKSCSLCVRLVHPRGADAREWASPPLQPLSPVSGHLA